MESTLRWQYKTIMCPTLSEYEISMAGLNQALRKGQGIAAGVTKWRELIDQELNALGSEGWELVSIWKSHFGDQGTCEWLTFKRLIE
jgi:hypothetical protein